MVEERNDDIPLFSTCAPTLAAWKSFKCTWHLVASWKCLNNSVNETMVHRCGAFTYHTHPRHDMRYSSGKIATQSPNSFRSGWKHGLTRSRLHPKYLLRAKGSRSANLHPPRDTHAFLGRVHTEGLRDYRAAAQRGCLITYTAALLLHLDMVYHCLVVPAQAVSC